MRISELPFKESGRAGKWSVYTDGFERHIYHYRTRMISFQVDTDRYPLPIVLHMSLGHGSVSDQQGMNQIFNAIRAPYYYQRAGGAQIVQVSTADLFPQKV